MLPSRPVKSIWLFKKNDLNLKLFIKVHTWRSVQFKSRLKNLFKTYFKVIKMSLIQVKYILGIYNIVIIKVVN